MFEKRVCVSGLIFLMIILNFSFASANLGQGDYEVDNTLLKLTIKQGEDVSRSLKIGSSENAELEVSTNLDFIEISETKLSLNANEEKELTIYFNVKDKLPGIYFGKILISNNNAIFIPVILEIESKEILFDGNIYIPPEYGKITVNKDAVVETKIFNLEKIGSKTVGVEYFISDFEGKIIYSEKENLPVENQILNTKTIPISAGTEPGNYVFGMIINYGSSVGTSSYIINVDDKNQTFDFGFLPWLVIILLIGLMFFIIYYGRQREKVFEQLQKQYKNELGKESFKIKKEKYKIRKLKPIERKEVLKKFKQKIKKRISAIKNIHKKRVSIVKKLKKQKKKGEVERKIGEWEKQGYNVNEFLIRTGKTRK